MPHDGGFAFNDNEDHTKELAKEDKPLVNKEVKTITFEHQKVIEELLATIALCPMDDELKVILRMRVWGRDPLVFDPMSCLEISMLLKVRVVNVERWEQDALYNMEQFLNRDGIVAISEKFVKDVEIKRLISPN